MGLSFISKDRLTVGMSKVRVSTTPITRGLFAQVNRHHLTELGLLSLNLFTPEIEGFTLVDVGQLKNASEVGGRV
jgi:hypothetical protein